MLALSFLLGIAGAVCIVLRSPNQGARRLPAGFGLAGLALVTGSFWTASRALHTVAAVFAVATLLMLAFSLVPAIGPLWRARRRAAGDAHD